MRPRPTLTDYIVIAISPALIMLLVGSLVFFLIEVFYQGQYQGRLQWVFACFVLGAVLIGRLSIEEGREYAAMFALPLAIVTLLALWRFVEFSGMLARVGWVVNVGLIGLIWWCADKLTWDCTVIDEQQDVSGEGLLQTVGLDDDASGNGNEDLEATSDRPPQAVVRPSPSFWQRFVEYRRRPHAPGVWVVYFSMAALPIFGLGQGFIFHDNQDSRRFVFKLLVVYVAAALGLLVTTSFLGLRRYLRQRRLEMPTEMAATWLGVGGAMIVALLLFCMLLPRRNAEYSITDLPAFAGAPDDLKSSRWGFGNDGPEEENAKRQVSRDDASQQSDRPGDQEGDNKGGQQQSSGKSKDKGDQQGQSEQSKSQQGNSEKKEQSRQRRQAEGSDSDQEQRTNDSQQGKEREGSGKSEDRKRSQQGDQGEQKQDQARQTQRDDQDSQQPGQQTQQREPARKPPSSRQFDPTRIMQNLGGGIGWLLKALYWLAAFVIVGYLLWKYWHQIREAVRNFIRAVQEFWARLFGGPLEPAQESEPDAAPIAATPRPFAAYANPFQSGQASQLPLPQLVQYSFEAFEAWARERGCGRLPEQTPHEFAQQVARVQAALSQDAVRLADMYNRTAYGRDALAATTLTSLQQLWKRLSDSEPRR